MVKAVISGYYGFKNFGDEAILSVLVEHLKKIGVDITVFSSDPDFTSKMYKVNSVKSFDLFKVVKSIAKSDILISGGGSLLQDVTSLKSLVYYSSIIALGLLFNKKVVIFAQGIGPINNNFAEYIVMNLLKFATLVTVRDELSLKLLDTNKVRAKIVCDPIYSLNVSRKYPENSVGIQLRDFKTMNLNLLNKLATFIANHFSDKKIEIFSLQQSLDMDVSRKFEMILHSIKAEINTEIVTDNIVERISKLEYMIGMRFHALLVAIKSGVKTCAINYDIKVEKLAADASIPIIPMSADIDFEELYSKLHNLSGEKLLEFAASKSFDWSIFDELFVISK